MLCTFYELAFNRKKSGSEAPPVADEKKASEHTAKKEPK
jgi:hypothetical protein